ncbi:MAG: saccharopine dehydrogenase NADP-binding domain-containing protein [Actinobacteria bacterium]|nr:saccharopine dehydrogenase NADP-binding domain-containing protein [Actinomycetota bacterium]
MIENVPTDDNAPQAEADQATTEKATTSKPPVKKAPTRKAPAKKTTAKKTPAKKATTAKAPAKKTTAAKAPAKKTTAKKSPAKKSPAKKSTTKKPVKAPANSAKKSAAPQSSAHGREDRPLDIVLYGATGFTGRLVAEYLAESAPAELRIGLAGRNVEKLKSVQAGIGGRAEHWPRITANSADLESLRRMARSARVVITTVGPYAKYGKPLTAACAEAGTHYVDLAGEVTFIRESADTFDEMARRHGARIVHACGFDSIPSDLGVLALHEAARAADGTGHLGDTDLVFTRLRGSFSGGTMASGALEAERLSKDKHARKLTADPYALSPDWDNDRRSDFDRDVRGPYYDDVLGTFVGPFVMAAGNARVVRRSDSLMDWAYGPQFHYREGMGTGSGVRGRMKAAALAAGLAAGTLGMTFGPTRSLAKRFMPEPGEGPSEESRRNGYFTAKLHSTTALGTQVSGEVSAKGDPGYTATALMISESAITLALGEGLPERTGVLTPASGIGVPLIERLRGAGMTITAEVAA